MIGNKEVPMDLNWLSEDERLVAEQAVATLRLVKQAGDAAPHGKGLFCLEQAVHDHGFPLLREILQRCADARPEGQKKRGKSPAL
jgi:hypothetical protein